MSNRVEKTSYGSAVVTTATLKGLCVIPVTVEVSIAPGLPGMDVVGMGDTAVHEARARVRSALKSAGFHLPRARITINLAPADVKKEGSSFDLAIALAILMASEQIPSLEQLCEMSSGHHMPAVHKIMVVGELSLTGEIRSVCGMLGFEQYARNHGWAVICAPASDEVHHDVPSFYLSNLYRLSTTSDTQLRYQPFTYVAHPGAASDSQEKNLTHSALDYRDIVGQECAKQACVIASVGDHSLLMVGPPGAGKTMMAQRMVTLLDPLSYEEQLECHFIHRVAGVMKGAELLSERPFRSPHHSATMAGLMGGGRPLLPGEVSLAHHGILFLDELAEFSHHVLQALREPLETKEVHLVRADGALRFPAHFRLVAASNPCACGYLGDPVHSCSCSASRLEAYRAKLGGPLADRIELHVHMSRPSPHEVLDGSSALDSQTMRTRVCQGKEFRSWRLAHESMQGSMSTAKTRDVVMMRFGSNAKARSLLKHAGSSLHLSARSLINTAHVGRTIADLHEHQEVLEEDVIEALSFRRIDQIHTK